MDERKDRSSLVAMMYVIFYSILFICMVIGLKKYQLNTIYDPMRLEPQISKGINAEAVFYSTIELRILFYDFIFYFLVRVMLKDRRESVKWTVLIFLWMVFIINMVALATGFYDFPKIYVENRDFPNLSPHALSSHVLPEEIFMKVFILVLIFSTKALIVFRDKKDVIEEKMLKGR